MKFRILTWSLAAAALVFSACRHDGSDPNQATTRSEGLEYAPQMYDSYPYEPYKQVDHNALNAGVSGGANVRPPVEGTIARGRMGYDLPYGSAPINVGDAQAWNAGYELAKTELTIPANIQPTAETMAYAEKVFTTYCDHCHGASGQGDGAISKAEKISVPSYTSPALMTLTPGQMFYSITYGKNAMGSHASQVSPDDRWKLVLHIQKLQGRLNAAGTTASDTTGATGANQ